MNKPLFLIRISSERVTCLGSELVDILNIVYSLVKSYVWYGADVEISGKFPFKWALEKNFPEKIGGFDAVIQIGRNTNQFLSGVFLLWIKISEKYGIANFLQMMMLFEI